MNSKGQVCSLNISYNLAMFIVSFHLFSDFERNLSFRYCRGKVGGLQNCCSVTNSALHSPPLWTRNSSSHKWVLSFHVPRILPWGGWEISVQSNLEKILIELQIEKTSSICNHVIFLYIYLRSSFCAWGVKTKSSLLWGTISKIHMSSVRIIKKVKGTDSVFFV